MKLDVKTPIAVLLWMFVAFIVFSLCLVLFDGVRRFLF